MSKLSFYKRVEILTDRFASQITGMFGFGGDLGSFLSGIVFENIGRIGGGAIGMVGNLPVILFSGRKRDADEIDPQDLPFREKIKHIWKFWKYPFEFASMAAMTQSIALGFFQALIRHLQSVKQRT